MKVHECILTLITGIGVFIIAMKLMSDSLNQIAGSRMKNILKKITGSEIKGVIIGALITSIIQSSSATTVMVIGFVNADIMDLNQATAIIIGSNIGTTITGILASLESFNISLYLSSLVFFGVMLSFINKLKKISNVFIGLGMLFAGLKMMSNSCDDKSMKEVFANILEKLEHPLLLELLGIIITAIIQSSSAMTGIIIVLVGKKVMTLRNGLYITLGSNVGTCVTALISIIGTNINSKRTALIHFIFNISGCILFTPILWIFGKPIIYLLELISSQDSIRIAYFHLFFNITTAFIMTPLINYLVRFVKYVIKDGQIYPEKDGKNKSESSSVVIDVSISNDSGNENTNEKDKFIKKDEIKKNDKDNSGDEKSIIRDEINNKSKKEENSKVVEENYRKNIIEEEKVKLNE